MKNYRQKYQPQLYVGADTTAEIRKKVLDRTKTLAKLRDISDDDVVKILGERTPGEEYKSVHPPLDEMEEPNCPIRRLVEPTPGAKAGDRIRFTQFTDSMYFSPITPTFRSRMYMSRYRGIDTIQYTGRDLLEARERDMEAYTSELLTNETFDPCRSAIRALTVHGHALRLQEDGLMFDAKQRVFVDKEKNEVFQAKDMHGRPLPEPISIGHPRTEEELKTQSTQYRWDGVKFRDNKDLQYVVGRIFELRALGGANPDLIKGK